jgi:hypothetical protein
MGGQIAVKRRKALGQVDAEQEDFISLMLSGAFSVAHAAEVGGFAVSTVRKWMQKSHYVRQELERRREAKRLIFDNWMATLRDQKATSWTKEDAAQKLMTQMGLTPEQVKERDRRCSDRRRELEDWRRYGDGDDDEGGAQDAPGSPPGPTLADLPSDDSPGAA